MLFESPAPWPASVCCDWGGQGSNGSCINGGGEPITVASYAALLVPGTAAWCWPESSAKRALLLTWESGQQCIGEMGIYHLCSVSELP